MEPQPPDQEQEQVGALLRAHRRAVGMSQSNPAIGLGSSFAGAMALFGWAGYQLDEKTGRSPLFILIGVFLGLFFGAYEVWKLVKHAEKEEEKPQGEGEA